MNYATIKYYDIANGPGVRTSIFVSGCRHHCPGCFNEVAWDFGYGQPFDKAVRNEIFASCQPDYIAGISLLGGEPFEPENQRELLPFVRNFRALYPNKSVWCYSGYTWEQLTGSVPCPARCEVTDELLSLLDVLVDGRFVEAHTREFPYVHLQKRKMRDLRKNKNSDNYYLIPNCFIDKDINPSVLLRVCTIWRVFNYQFFRVKINSLKYRFKNSDWKFTNVFK